MIDGKHISSQWNIAVLRLFWKDIASGEKPTKQWIWYRYIDVCAVLPNQPGRGATSEKYVESWHAFGWWQC